MVRKFAAASAFVLSLSSCVPVAFAITGPCTNLEIDAPCDPGGGVGECGGVCRLNTSGTPTCVSLGSLGLPSSYDDGRLCGSATQSDDCGFSGKVCSAGGCVDPPSFVQTGTACRPSSTSNRCGGACNGSGTCVNLNASGCAYGRGAPGGATNCEFGTCGALASSCEMVPLPDSTTCDDADPMTINDICTGGTCSGTPTGTTTTTTISTETTTTTTTPDSHRKCYKIKDPATKATYTLDLAAAPEPAEVGCILRAPAKLLCLVSTKTNVTPPPSGGGPPTTTTGAKLLCYKIKCPKASLVPVPVEDQFGGRTVTPGAAKMLCVPAL
jgi:hypothetical protein